MMVGYKAISKKNRLCFWEVESDRLKKRIIRDLRKIGRRIDYFETNTYEVNGYFTWLWVSFFKISTFVALRSQFFLPTQRIMLSRPPRYLECFRKAYRKSSGGTWKKVSNKNTWFCQNIPTWFWASFFMFWVKTFFFSSASRNFSVSFTKTFKVSGRFA